MICALVSYLAPGNVSPGNDGAFGSIAGRSSNFRSSCDTISLDFTGDCSADESGPKVRELSPTDDPVDEDSEWDNMLGERPN